MDGSNALPDQGVKSGKYRDEFACTRLQYETCNEHPGYQTIDRGNTSVESKLSVQYALLQSPLKRYQPVNANMNFNT